MNTPFLSFTIPVTPRTKKNSQSFVTLKNGRTLLLPSKPYQKFEKEVVKYIENNMGNLETINFPINMKAVYFREARRKADIVGYHQALQDALVKAGFIEDDNCKIVYSLDGSKVSYDKENPRIEVEITKLEYANPDLTIEGIKPEDLSDIPF